MIVPFLKVSDPRGFLTFLVGGHICGNLLYKAIQNHSFVSSILLVLFSGFPDQAVFERICKLSAIAFVL